MFCLNIGWWNSSTLRTIKLPNLDPDDMVISLKMKIMEILQATEEITAIELIYCGSLMENMEKIGFYVKEDNSLAFISKKETWSEKLEEKPAIDMQTMLQKYREMYRNPEFKERILRYLKPEYLTKLRKIYRSELSNDLFSRSIIKDINLFKSILKPNALKSFVETHPVLVSAVDNLVKDMMKCTDGIFGYPLHLSDDDYSESDDIEIDYNHPTPSTFDPDRSQLSFFLRNTIREIAIEDGAFHPPHSFFENIILDFQRNRQPNGQEQNTNNGLSSQLHQMHELGFLDDLLNYRALQVAGGNVQQAVDMILNRVIE